MLRVKKRKQKKATLSTNLDEFLIIHAVEQTEQHYTNLSHLLVSQKISQKRVAVRVEFLYSKSAS